MSSEVELRNAATDLLSLLRDYMVVTSLTANDRFEEAVERLRVALSASPSIGRVGALEWTRSSFGGQAWRAHSLLGLHRVYSVDKGEYGWAFEGFDGTEVIARAPDEIAAKAAAQADYEARIRSTLVYHEEPAGDAQGAAKPVAWRAITVAGNVLYFAANDKPVEPSWEIIPLYAAPAALVSPPDNGEPTEAEIDDAVRCIDLGVSAGIADTVNVGAALRRFVAGRAALQSHNEGSE